MATMRPTEAVQDAERMHKGEAPSDAETFDLD